MGQKWQFLTRVVFFLKFFFKQKKLQNSTLGHIQSKSPENSKKGQIFYSVKIQFFIAGYPRPLISVVCTPAAGIIESRVKTGVQSMHRALGQQL